MKTVISLESVGVCFRSRRSFFRFKHFDALKDVSFDLHTGDALGVIGRNGVGKSTLLRVIAGIISPDRGKVINRGVSTALLSLQTGFDPEVTGRRNAILSGMLLGFSKREMHEKLDRIVDFSELGSYIDEPVKTYSAGMRARLGFSIAVQMKPDVLLIDEILGVGDTEFRKKSEQALQAKIVSEQTVVLVSHNAAEIKRLCNRAVWIENGVTMKEGKSADVIGAYEAYLKTHHPGRGIGAAEPV